MYKKDESFLLDAFGSIHKDENETVFEFNIHFSKLYYSIPFYVRPNLSMDLLYYFKSYGIYFSFFLGEKELQDLNATLTAGIKIEKNIMASRYTQFPFS